MKPFVHTPFPLVRWLGLICLGLLSWPAFAQDPCQVKEPYPDNDFPTVRFETSLGPIEVELDRQRAPLTVNNFMRYVTAGRYDNTVFHRVMPGFVVQGGGYSPKYKEIPLCAPLFNESGNGLRNDEGTLAMARFDAPHSATSQFYFNLKDNDSLNPNPKRWGYAVFGYVTEGMDVLKKIAAVKTGYHQGLDAENVPLEPVILKKVTVISAD